VAPSPTKSGTRRLSDVARKLVVPEGIVSTGWPVVLDTCNKRLGVTFDSWQDGAGRLILAKREDGKLACMIGGVGLSLPRQVGKTHLIGALVFALCILRPGLLVIWSSQHARTHGETFLAMQAFAARVKVRPYIKQVFTGSGDEEVRFLNSSRILFGARERGFGRGIPGVDVIVSDEAQIMSDKAIDAQLATMNTSQFGLAIYAGTPPRPDDPSEAFTRMRVEAWKGELRDAVWIELGAERGASPDDRVQWAMANPSYPHRTPTESMLRLRRKLTPESFLREGLGIWDDDEVDSTIPQGTWRSLALPATSQIVSSVVFAVDVSPDRRHASIAVAGATDEGRLQVEVVADGDGTTWAPGTLAELVLQWDPLAVVIDRASAASSLQASLVAEGIEPTMTGSPEMGQTCGGFYDDAMGGVLAHLDDPVLNDALMDADTRRLGDAWAWNRRGRGQITPLVAVTLAHYGFTKFYRPAKRSGPGPSRERRAARHEPSTEDLSTTGF